MLYYIAVLPFILGLISLKHGRIGLKISEDAKPFIFVYLGWKKDCASFWIAIAWFVVAAVMVAMQWDYNNTKFIIG